MTPSSFCKGQQSCDELTSRVKQSLSTTGCSCPWEALVLQEPRPIRCRTFTLRLRHRHMDQDSQISNSTCRSWCSIESKEAWQSELAEVVWSTRLLPHLYCSSRTLREKDRPYVATILSMRLNSYMGVWSRQRKSLQTSAKMSSTICPMLTLTKCRLSSYQTLWWSKASHLRNL